MKWRLRKRAPDSNSEELDQLLAVFDVRMLALVDCFETTTAAALRWQSLAADVANALQRVEEGQPLSPEDAANLRNASTSLCLDLADVIGGVQAAADMCRRMAENARAHQIGEGGYRRTDLTAG